MICSMPHSIQVGSSAQAGQKKVYDDQAKMAKKSARGHQNRDA